MKNIKKTTAFMLSAMLGLGICSYQAYADENQNNGKNTEQTVVWDIENAMNAASCEQGDTVKMSVTLKNTAPSKQETPAEGADAAKPETTTGSAATAKQETTAGKAASSKPQGSAETTATLEYSSLDGTLEYDTSLFSVGKADILPVEKANVKEWSFDQSTGVFHIQYAKDIAVADGGLLLEIQLHVAQDASTGRTTLCVTQMKWNGSASLQATEIEHRIPARLTIAEAEKEEDLIGDVNRDGEVNLTDAKMVMQYYNGTRKLNSQQRELADANQDGKVNLTDAKLIMQYFNGEIAEF